MQAQHLPFVRDQWIRVSEMSASTDKIRVAILGASGYTGAELVRLLSCHPNVDIVAIAGDRTAGQTLDTVLPHLGMVDVPTLVKIDDVDYAQVDAVFCGLPHATTQEVVLKIPNHVKVIDISADFRLENIATYKEWYGGDHQAVDLQKEAVYGLTEFYREQIKTSRIIACPGCYPTTSLLPLVPLLQAGVIESDRIIIDAKSGVSGAGRAEKQANLFSEVSEGLHAYGVGHHRHMPEIEQELSKAAAADVTITFTPHLIPMNRGILATIYAKLAPGQSVESAHAALVEKYNKETFVSVLPLGQTPATRHVRGSNYAMIGIASDRHPGHIILVSVTDNLVKGASGQAIQNFNLVFGLPESAGLTQKPLFP